MHVDLRGLSKIYRVFISLTNNLTFAGNMRAFLVIIQLKNVASVRARVQKSGAKRFNDKLGRYQRKLRTC